MNAASAPNSVAARALSAVEAGDHKALEQALAAGADPGTVDAQGVPLLQLALKRHDRVAFRTLLERGASPSQRSALSGRTATHLAVLQETDPWWLETLIAHKADLDAPNADNGDRPLMDAILAQNETAFERLLQAGADPNARNSVGETSLHAASHLNWARYSLRLLQAGADAAARTRTGASFQDYQWMTSEDLLAPQAKREREALRAWLREHGIAVQESTAAKR